MAFPVLGAAALAGWGFHSSAIALGIVTGGFVAALDFGITAWCVRHWFQPHRSRFPVAATVIFGGKFAVSVWLIYLIVRSPAIHWLGLIAGITIALIVIVLSGIYWIRVRREPQPDEQ